VSAEALASARGAALTPPHAHGGPPAAGVLRATPEDFVVEEELGFSPSGAGTHVLLRVRKRNANTQWVARELARLAGCRVSDVGYAGLKDRRAIAVQWFTVPRPRAAVDWPTVAHPEFTVLEAHPHARKLPRGALAGNRFSVRIAAGAGGGAELAARLKPRLAEVMRQGVPNYFGPQRFGREGANLARLSAALPALAPAERSFVLSAARSLLFNALLARRVADGSWAHLLAGDVAVLDGRGSIFAVPEPDATLAARIERLEIHPTGALWGEGPPPTGADVQALEQRIAGEFGAAAGLCVAAGMRQERRSLRLAAQELHCETEQDAVRLSFRLPRGSFATALLRELVSDTAALGEV
jgi:tRNA pseudouridine13 synthase